MGCTHSTPISFIQNNFHTCPIKKIKWDEVGQDGYTNFLYLGFNLKKNDNNNFFKKIKLYQNKHIL